MSMPNFSSLAGLEVVRLIRSGKLGKANQEGSLCYLNQVGLVSV